MRKTYTSSFFAHKWSKLALATLLVSGVATTAQAQFGYVAAISQNTAGTYIDLGATGTVIATDNNDDANSLPQEIGFAFNFNGVNFTQFVLNTNGYVRLGAEGASAVSQFNPIGATGTANTNIIAPLSYTDLYGAADQVANPTSFRVTTAGETGSRVCTIQFKNLRDKSSATVPAQLSTAQFQIKLYEGSNVVEFVYGAWTASSAAPTSQVFVIGIKGTTFSAGNAIIVSKSATDSWQTSEFYGIGTLYGNFVVNNVLPDAGRTYRFNTTPANDASVAAIYTMGKLPLLYATPHTVQARVTNSGRNVLTNLPVTLRVTGPNAFTNVKTVATLAPGASTTVSFDSYTPTVTGTSSVTVSIPEDGNPTNNLVGTTQLVNPSVFSYAAPGIPATGNIGYSTGSGLLVAKYTTNTPRRVTAVNLGLVGTTSVGRTVYAVLCNSAGAILARSSDYVITTNDIGNTRTFPLVTPIDVTSGDFYVGLAQTAFTTAYSPLGTEAETPTRPGTFFSAPLAGGALADIAASNLGRLFIEAVTTSIVTSNSAELQQALAVYPNPSKGVFSLAISGLTAKSPLQVQVTNQLGQVVYTGTAKNETVTRLDLTKLAAGVYNLKLQNEQQYTVQKLIIE